MGSPPVGDFHYWIYVIRKFETVPQEDKEESQNHEWKGNSRLTSKWRPNRATGEIKPFFLWTSGKLLVYQCLVIAINGEARGLTRAGPENVWSCPIAEAKQRRSCFVLGWEMFWWAVCGSTGLEEMVHTDPVCSQVGFSLSLHIDCPPLKKCF